MTMQVMEALCLLSIGLLGYRTMALILEGNPIRRARLRHFVQDETENKPETMTFLEKISSYKRFKANLEYQLHDAKMDVDAKQFVRKRIVLAMCISSSMLFLYAWTKFSLYLVLSLPLGLLVFMLSFRIIKKWKQAYETKMKMELPEYLSAFAVLLKSYTPYVATRKSLDYAGELLKPYVARLITQMELYPASQKPYETFAEDVPEAKEFMIALNQMMKVDSQQADNIIREQIQIMDELLLEAYREQIEVRPQQVERYITPMLFPLIAIILTFLCVLISDTFKGIT